MSSEPLSGPSQPARDWSQIARRIRVPLGFLFAIAYVLLADPTRNSMIVGALALVPGLLLRALASGHVQKNEQLTTTGPYAYTRNPLYVGSLILAIGFAIAARSWWIVVMTVVMFSVIYLPVISAEEKFLRQTFPEFDQYAHEVPRFGPRLTPFRRDQGQFSAALYWKHREYNALLGCAIVLVILAAKLLW